jgi:hypothetical protein
LVIPLAGSVKVVSIPTAVLAAPTIVEWPRHLHLTACFKSRHW